MASKKIDDSLMTIDDSSMTAISRICVNGPLITKDYSVINDNFIILLIEL